MSSGIVEQTASPRVLSDEQALYEIVNGQPVEQPPMSIYSNLIAFRFSQYLAQFADKNELGTVVMEALLILDSVANLRRRPDVAFVDAERWPLDRELPEEGDWEVVPTLAVEVTSPHDIFHEVHGKVREYFDHGVKRVWVVIPEEQQVYVYSSPTQTEILDTSRTLRDEELLPGFEITLEDLFRRTPTRTS